MCLRSFEIIVEAGDTEDAAYLRVMFEGIVRSCFELIVLCQVCVAMTAIITFVVLACTNLASPCLVMQWT